MTTKQSRAEAAVGEWAKPPAEAPKLGGIRQGRTSGGRRRVVTHLTDAELAALVTLAEADGLTVAAMIRVLIRRATAGR